MSTLSEMLVTLNARRAAAGEAPLKAWKRSADALSAEIAKYPAPEAPRALISVAAWARANGHDPKIVRSFLRRHFATPANGWMATDEIVAKWNARRIAARASA